MFYLAVFEERIGETEVVLFKIVEAFDLKIARKLAERDAEENSSPNSVRVLREIEEIGSLEDISVPFKIKEV